MNWIYPNLCVGVSLDHQMYYPMRNSALSLGV